MWCKLNTIIGNDKTKELLKQSVISNRTSHSYLFLGKAGTGKRLIAQKFAKMVLCLKKEEDCNTCQSCIKFNSNNNPDFIFIEPEKGSIKIEQIRNMQKQVAQKPIISNNKICIINDADMMTPEAQNCLLKTLEEPPIYMTIILIGANESNFLVTIKSRCTIINFEPIKDEEIKKYLEDNFDYKEVNSNIINLANGSIGKAISLKDKAELYTSIDNIISNIEKCDIIELLKEADIIYKLKDEIFEVLEYINILLIEQSKQNYKYANCIQIVEETKKRLKSNSNYNMSIDYMLFGIWEEVNEKYSRSKI